MLKQQPNSSASNLEKSEKKNIEQLKQLLSSAKSLPRLVSSTGEEVVLSEFVYNKLYQVLEAMESGTEITISPIDRNVSITRAAEILNMSPSYLVELLDQGEIPYTTMGSTRHIKIRDIFNYKGNRDAQRRKDLNELTAFLQEEGFYTEEIDSPQ